MRRFCRILTILLVCLVSGAQAIAGARDVVLCVGDCGECREPAKPACCPRHEPAEVPDEPCQPDECPCVAVPVPGEPAKAAESFTARDVAVPALVLAPARIEPEPRGPGESRPARDEPPRPPPGPPLSTIVLLI